VCRQDPHLNRRTAREQKVGNCRAPLRRKFRVGNAGGWGRTPWVRCAHLVAAQFVANVHLTYTKPLHLLHTTI
jgi:hypothetical protein